MNSGKGSALILGFCICAGLVVLCLSLGSALIRFKNMERFVSVKGLSEREVSANIVVWPLSFASADNDLGALYAAMEENAKKIVAFFQEAGFSESEITVGAPVVTDRFARRYESQPHGGFRYTAHQTVTVYTGRVDAVRALKSRLGELGKKGIALGGEGIQSAEFLFTKLNELKPAMVEETTRNARAVAEKFAADSKSRLGKIKRASQGQFSIEDRDSNTPHIKKVRVVSTVEYYLSD